MDQKSQTTTKDEQNPANNGLTYQPINWCWISSINSSSKTLFLELTYPTLGKGKIIKMDFSGGMLPSLKLI